MSASIPLAVSHPASLVRNRKLVTIASGKGGVGKTWLAVTLSHALARAGKKTLLFDGDLGLANVDVQLGLMPRHDLSAVVAGRVALGEAVQPFTGGGFDIVAGRSGSGILATMDKARVAGLRRDLLSLADDYDHVVLDLSAGVESAVRALARTGGPVLVVTTDEPTSLTDAYAFIKIMTGRAPDLDFRVVVNMAGGKREGERTYATLRKACESFLGLSPPLAGIVRRDLKVRDAIRHQTALLTRHPTSAAAKDVEAICARLLGGP
jgi:flagellar biosynthesis protein FlhG